MNTNSSEALYVIRHRSSGLVKIGITNDWLSRSTALLVSVKCDALKVVACQSSFIHERRLHHAFKDFRLPQSEWFHLDEEKTQSLIVYVGDLGPEIDSHYSGCRKSLAQKAGCWERPFRRRLFNAVGPALTVSPSRGWIRLARRLDDGTRQRITLPFKWETASCEHALAWIVAINRELQSRPALSLTEVNLMAKANHWADQLRTRQQEAA